MVVYVEYIYMINFMMILTSYVTMSILISLKVAYHEMLIHTFIMNFGILIMYFDVLKFLLFGYWGVLFFCIYRKNALLYYPFFLFVYLSLLAFLSTFMKDSFIYYGMLISSIHAIDIAAWIVALMFILSQIFYIAFLQKKNIKHSLIYSTKIHYLGQDYQLKGFLDTGNEVFYQGYPLILIREGIIEPYHCIDTIDLYHPEYEKINVIEECRIQINGYQVNHAYIGIMKNIQYDCLLNIKLMGGIEYDGNDQKNHQ